MLVDQMRGRSSAWYRIRVNLQHVPEELRLIRNRMDPTRSFRGGRMTEPRGWWLVSLRRPLSEPRERRPWHPPGVPR